MPRARSVSGTTNGKVAKVAARATSGASGAAGEQEQTFLNHPYYSLRLNSRLQYHQLRWQQRRDRLASHRIWSLMVVQARSVSLLTGLSFFSKVALSFSNVSGMH
mmetsp:Transcript_41718/g.66251  ORF Transcript_41718/g.66251 Transcript_41718/m.66251 type:complete len:105 (-) Transcript_41718:57-371(-)